MGSKRAGWCFRILRVLDLTRFTKSAWGDFAILVLIVHVRELIASLVGHLLRGDRVVEAYVVRDALAAAVAAEAAVGGVATGIGKVEPGSHRHASHSNPCSRRERTAAHLPALP